LLYHRLQDLETEPASLPAPILAEFQLAYYSTLAHNARLEVDLVDVVQILRREGV
jgi:hypothetical protein